MVERRSPKPKTRVRFLAPPLVANRKAMRNKTRKKSLLIPIGLGAVFFGLFLCLPLYLVFESEALAVRSLEIGDSKFSGGDASISAISRKGIGENFLLAFLGPDNLAFWYILKRKEADYSRDLPYVNRLNIDLDLKNRRVLLDLVEREPFGVWCFSDRGEEEENIESKDCYAFDRDGVLFVESPEVYGTLILRIDDRNDRIPVLGKTAFPEEDWLSKIVDVLEIMKKAGLGAGSVEIKEFNLREWSIWVRDGTEFRFSFNFMPDDLLRVLVRLSEEVDLEKARYVDLRVPGRIYYRYR